MYVQDAWHCRACLKSYPKTIELDLARYQFALLVGAYGQAVTVMRRRIYAWATSVMDGAGAVTGETILQVQAAAVLIDIRPTWPHDRCISLNSLRPKTFPPASGYQGKLEQIVGPLMPLAVVDTLLRPDAYLAHYAKCLQNRKVPVLNSKG
jgi:hypothetical protein